MDNYSEKISEEEITKVLEEIANDGDGDSWDQACRV